MNNLGVPVSTPNLAEIGASGMTHFDPLPGGNLENRIREYIRQNLLYTEADYPHQDNASFIANGVIDSLGVLELVTFVGREFDIRVSPEQVTPENFDSVTALAAYVRRQRAPIAGTCHVST